jgi:hypothetical protein
VAFVGLTVSAFVVTSAGFSPQFVAWLMPFIVLLLPNLRGFVYATALTLVTLFVERVVYFSLFPEAHWLLWVIVAVRTLLILALCAEAYALLAPEFAPTLERVRTRALPAIAVGSLVVVVGSGAALAAEYVATGQQPDRTVLLAVQLSEQVPPGDAIIFTDGDLYTRLYPYLMDRPVFLLSKRALASVGDPSVEPTIREIARRFPWPHVVLGPGDPDRLGGPVVDWLSRYGYLVRRSTLGGAQVLSFALPSGLAKPSEAPEVVRRESFGDALDLLGYRVSGDGHVAPGESLDLTLYWRATRRLAADYTLEMRLLGPSGAVVATYERQPVGGSLPTSAWTPGEVVIDDHHLPVGPDLPAGVYRVEVGWHDARGEQLAVARGGVDRSDLIALQPVEVREFASSTGAPVGR